MSKHFNVTQYYGLGTPNLQKLHTLQLMNILKFTRCWPNRCTRFGCSCAGEYLPKAEREENRLSDELHQNVKTVLATREHVPNKPESKALRQAQHRRTEKKVMAY